MGKNQSFIEMNSHVKSENISIKSDLFNRYWISKANRIWILLWIVIMSKDLIHHSNFEVINLLNE